jgi:LuxR family transcriptional regulator, maltose regulon positive regulatory protein
MTVSIDQPKQLRRERRIIERPRLIKMLDDCEARVILLLAPAGYGKTTLARQWAKTLNGVVWLSLTPAHRDVVTFAQDLSIATDSANASTSAFIDEFLRARSNPQREARGVARALSKHLTASNAGWLVIDDYHEIAAEPVVDAMTSFIAEASGLRVLVSSRVRPGWVTTRRVMYGEVDEIGRDELAMTVSESVETVGRRPDLKTLVDHANGWPAVISLAGSLNIARPWDGVVPSALHDYVAEELYQSATAELQGQLLELALLPTLSPAVLRQKFGDMDTVVIERGRELGFLTGDPSPDLHPLIREFLLLKASSAPDAETVGRDAVSACISGGYWEYAFELVHRFSLFDMMESLLQSAYRPLVRSGRVGSLLRFANQIRSAPIAPPPEVDLVDAEVALSDGKFGLAIELVRRTRARMPSNDILASRAAAIQGSAAFQISDFDGSEIAFEAAAEAAQDDFDEAEALHGLALAAIYGERQSVDRRIAALGARAERTGGPVDVARHAASALARMRIGSGFADSAYADDALRVLPNIADPRARTSILVTLTYSLGLQCEYESALTLSTQMLSETEAFGLEFARPHGLWNRAFVLLGLRRFAEANRSLVRIEEIQRQQPLGHHTLNARALRARLLMQLARVPEAFELVRQPIVDKASPAMIAEYVATRGLALALLGRVDEAESAVAEASATSISSEIQVMVQGVRAISAVRTGDSRPALSLLELARARRVWDPVVCCLRASPALADHLAEHDELRAELTWLYQRSRDDGLARRAGFRSMSFRNPATLLSRREVEVLELMCEGFRNREIANAFVISQSTVKVHVRHILEKLGVRTRTEAVARYQALEKGDP